MVSRPSIFAPGAGVPAAAAADGSVWGVWPEAEAEPTPEPTIAEPTISKAAVPANSAPPKTAQAPATPVDDVPWDEMMRRHGRRVVVSLVGRGVPLERAKELAQDAWLRVIDRHRAGLFKELSLPGLVITQAGFLASDDVRREERRARLDRPRQEQAAANLTLDPEGQLNARQQLRTVRGVIDRASPNAQRVFALLYGEQAMTPTEVAQELGLSVQRVRQIVCELRKRMRAAIAEPRRKLR